MKLIIPGDGHVTIDDNSVEAQKIRAGHEYKYDEKLGLVVTEKKLTLEAQIAAATSIEDVKVILLQLIKK